MVTSEPLLKYNLNFTPTSASDVVLVSADAVHFAVQRSVVESSSGIFKHAFEDGQLSEDDQKPRIYLAEASDVVETLLTYCYPFLMPGFELTSNSWDVICAAHKYQVVRALGAIKAAFNLRLKTESLPIAEHDLEATVFASQCGFPDLEGIATKRLLDEEPSTEDLLRWIKRIEAHFPVEIQSKLILLLHQHHERAQLLRTRLGQHLASVTSAHNHGPPDPVHLYDCTFIGAIWRLWEESRNYNSISQLEGFVKRASAELSSLGAVADETQKRSLEQAVESFKQLVEGLKGLSVALLGV